MNINCFKLNEGKTEILDIGYYESPVQAISLNKSLTIGPVLKAKNLGFYFDHRMSIDNEISPTQKVCHIQLQNLWLKIRLDHSCVLSHLDYCNAAYGLLSEANLSKLKKATKFCYSLYIQSLWVYGKKRSELITLCTKKLHFLPVRYRIKNKVCLLVFKCINNLALKYLSDLIKVRDVNLHNIRKDNDFFILSYPPPPDFTVTHGAFSHYGPSVRNRLP